MRYIYDITSWLLLVRVNGISLHKWSVGTAHLRTVRGTLPLGVATLTLKTAAKSIECEFQSNEQFALENNFKRTIVNSAIWMGQVRRRLLGFISSVKARAALYKQTFFKCNSYQIECFLKQSICIDKFPCENNFKRTKILFSNGLIWMSLVCRELTVIIIAL